jgi:hypothetical protein
VQYTTAVEIDDRCTEITIICLITRSQQ